MADDFKGTENIILRPFHSEAPFNFDLPVCSTASANDGAVPYGRTVSTVAVKAWSEADVDVSTEMVNSATESAELVTVQLNYPSTTGAGKYRLVFEITLDGGNTKLGFEFTRVRAAN